jgi:hypothetical protein
MTVLAPLHHKQSKATFPCHLPFPLGESSPLILSYRRKTVYNSILNLRFSQKENAMTLTINLPDELASRLTRLLPEQEHDRFTLSALDDALTARQQEYEARFAESLLAEIDIEQEPEREAVECTAIIEAEFAAMQTNDDSLTLEEVRQQWESEKAARRAVK